VGKGVGAGVGFSVIACRTSTTVSIFVRKASTSPLFVTVVLLSSGLNASDVMPTKYAMCAVSNARAWVEEVKNKKRYK
jgi:hypothetical protein